MNERRECIYGMKGLEISGRRPKGKKGRMEE